MTRAHKIANLIGVPAPLIGLVVAIVLLWNRAVGTLELGLLVGLYVVTALGVTLGYHRMFTHRAFESSRAFRAIIGVLGSMAVQGSVITWVADHRMHHAFTDQDGDPHSPHLSGPGLLGGIKGLWHAHVGWLFETVGTAERERFAADLDLRVSRSPVLGAPRRPDRPPDRPARATRDRVERRAGQSGASAGKSPPRVNASAPGRGPVSDRALA